MARPGWELPAGLCAGVLLAQLFFINQWPVWPLTVVLFGVLAYKQRLWPLVILIGLLWTSFGLQTHLDDRLDLSLSGKNHFVEGWIEGLPQERSELTRFRFKPVDKVGAISLPNSLLTYWYRDAPPLKTGEFWRLQLQLKPPWGRLNFHGSDRELWLFSQGIGGLATVRSGTRLESGGSFLSGWNKIREAIRSHLGQSVHDISERGLITALAIADRSRLATEHAEILSKTGTAHLLAISGLHIGLAALFGLWLTRLLCMTIPLRWGFGLNWQASLLGGFTVAFGYAALAGFGTSTVRALLMLGVGILALLRGRNIHPGQAILGALVVILLIDPLAVLSSGFWLSFSAVGVLLLLFGAASQRGEKRWCQLMRAQIAIMVVLLPLSAWWFQSASVAGLLANLLAIPWVSIIVVPLILLGLILMPLSTGVSSVVFSIAGEAAGLLLKLLAVLASAPFSSLTLSRPDAGLVIFATLGALILLLPRGLRSRWLGLPLCLPLFAFDLPPAKQQLQMDILDVGQGTAVLISSSTHLLVYDSGPGDAKNFNLVNSVIRPAILRSGHASPDLIMISHADLDHAGGLQALRDLYPYAQVHASLPEPLAGTSRCDNTLQWQWDGISFQVLHPTSFLPYIGNDSSCVLSISLNGSSILLPGDISRAAEQRLLLQDVKTHRTLLVPHHGSNTSSAVEFLRTLKPEIAIATAGLGNRFGFPRPEVQQRYADAGIPLLSTNACGALRLVISADGEMDILSARKQRSAPWRWPAGESCP